MLYLGTVSTIPISEEGPSSTDRFIPENKFNFVSEKKLYFRMLEFQSNPYARRNICVDFNSRNSKKMKNMKKPNKILFHNKNIDIHKTA